MPLSLPRLLVLFLIGPGLLVGCSRGVDVSTLPPVPAIDTQRYLPVIQQQLESAKQQVDRFPDKAATNGKLGMLLYTYDQFASAAVLLDRAGALAPQEFRWPYLAGRARAELGQTGAAEASLLRALELNPDYGPINIQLAELYLKASRDDDAQAAVNRVLEIEPQRPEAHFILAKLAARRGEAGQAIDHLERVEQLSGPFAALHYQYSQLYRQLGENDLADDYLALYEQFRDITADVVDPVLGDVQVLNQGVSELVSRAKRYVTRGDQPRALELLEQAVGNDPDSLAAHVTLVGLYASKGEFAKADEHIAAASGIDPDHPKLHYAVGVARLLEKRRTEAAMAFERSLRHDPGNVEAHVQLGMLLEQDQNVELAVLRYNRVLSQVPMHRIARWRLGRIQLARGDASAAIDFLENIRTLTDPATPEILLDLAKAYAGAGRLGDAVETLDECVRVARQFENIAVTSQARALQQRYRREIDERSS